MVSGDIGPMALFVVVYLPAKLGAECPGSLKSAVNSP